MPKSNTELSEELFTEMRGIIVRSTGMTRVSRALVEELRCAVLRDFSLAGVRARGLTPAELTELGKRGGRPRRGETAEEARIRRGLAPDNGVSDYDDDAVVGGR